MQPPGGTMTQKHNEAFLRKTKFDNHEIRGSMQQLIAQIVLSDTLSAAEKRPMKQCINSVIELMNKSLQMSKIDAKE